MKDRHIIKVDNTLRDSASKADRRNVNNFRDDFSLIMDFRLLMEDIGIKVNHPYRTMEQRLLFVTGGHAVAEFNAIEMKLYKDVVILMPENCTMELLSASDDFNAHGLAFRVSDSENYGFIQYNPLRLELSARDGEFIEKFFQLFDELFSMKIKDPKPSESLCSFVMSYLHYLYNIAYGNAPFISRKQKTFNEFIQLINMHALKHREVAYYSNLLGVSENYLSVLVKEQSSRNAKNWINHIVAREAKLLLRSSCEKMERIAIQLGFYNATQFSTFFKKQTGQTPMEYRNGKGITKG